MKTLKVVLVFLFLTMAVVNAQDFETVKKQFKNVDALEMDLVSGDCEVTVGNSKVVTVTVKYDVEPKDCFKPEFSQKGKSLVLEEEWKSGRCNGKVLWSVEVPKNVTFEYESASGDLTIEGLSTEIEVETASGDVSMTNCDAKIEIEVASGDIEAKNCNGDIEISTASGDVEIEDCKGDIELSTASGDIEAENLAGSLEFSLASGDMELDNCIGEFDISAASGDIDARGLKLEGASSFSAASGDVNVVLGESPKYDIVVSVASGDVTLDFNGNKIVGTIEMTADKKRGKINAPFKEDRIEEIKRHGRTYIAKTFIRGSSPMITIETASGDATLKKVVWQLNKD